MKPIGAVATSLPNDLPENSLGGVTFPEEDWKVGWKPGWEAGMGFGKVFRGFAALSILCGAASAQINVTHTFDLKLGSISAPENILLDFGGTAVAVFSRVPGPAVCPTVHHGDFHLKKLNPGAGPATNEPTTGCAINDSVSINTEAVWELHTAEQKVYYIQMAELLPDKKVKIRLTNKMPVLRLTGGPSVPGQSSGSAEYLVDGKKILPKAANILVGPKK